MDLNGYKCFGVTKMDTPIRLTPSGGIECFSTDGKVCANNFKHDVTCRQFVARHKRDSKPVMCNKKDFQDKKHWCYNAKKFFFKKWHCPHETGLSVAVKFSKKMKVKCLSEDGKKCYRGQEAIKKCQKANVCYKKSGKKSKKGGKKFSKGRKSFMETSQKRKMPYKSAKCRKSDYMKGNWCAKAYSYFRYTGDFLCNGITGLDVAIKLSSKGKVECLSSNGKECLTGLKSDFECIKSIMKATEDYSVCPKTIQCSKGDFIQDTWCHTGYQKIYHRLPTKKLIAFRKIKKTVKKHLRKIYEPSYVQPWIQVIRGFIKTKVARTKQGIKEFKKLLKTHKVQMPRRVQKYIIKIIKRGRTTSKRILEQVMKKIIKFRNGGVKIKLKVNSKQCYKKAMGKLAKLLKRKDAQSDKGVKRVMRFIDTRFVIKPNVRKFVRNLIVEKDLKKKFELKNVIRQIKDYISKRHLRVASTKIRLEVKCDTKFFKKLAVMLKKDSPHSKKGLKKIKRYFKGHFSLRKKVWRLVKNIIKDSPAKSDEQIKTLIEKIKEVIPKRNLEKSLWIKNIHY
jgi:hypothetical protein